MIRVILIHMNIQTRITDITRQIATDFIHRPPKQRASSFIKKIPPTTLATVSQNVREIYDDGYGIKLIARELGLPYSPMRTFLKKALDVRMRSGYDVVTDRLRAFRSEKAKVEGLGREWPRKYVKNNKGIQGYYWNKYKKKYCWLRSSYEYIYAKFLDRNKISWDSEVKYFTLDTGEKYLPDFFIYEDGVVKYVVEIKGSYKIYDRKKHEHFKEHPIVLVNNIKNYLETGSNLSKELKLWKLNRVLTLSE